MKNTIHTLGVILLICLFIIGIATFSYEIVEAADQKADREYIRFQRDSLQLELYKIQIKQNNEIYK